MIKRKPKKEEPDKIVVQLRSLITAVKKARANKNRMCTIKGFLMTTKAAEDAVKRFRDEEKKPLKFVVTFEYVK